MSGIIDKLLLRSGEDQKPSKKDDEAHGDALEPQLWCWDLMIVEHIPRKEDWRGDRIQF